MKGDLTVAETLDADTAARAAVVQALRGRDLGSWCGLDQVCHADILLEVANG